ncbi:hypothetical protein DPMN_090917 [Dreissena polymorpha]|uniref:Uncharacterized protein n=1 Tax=Dreissena polymorpha TaxID=45954 RepID=A0A9D4R079_DREPO|nr:hypothetical protein DPMN_090917 [Dreissena polymorpha]
MSSASVAITSIQRPSVKSSTISRRSSATSRSTSNRKCEQQHHPAHSRRATNFLTVR